jgi:hypothetical protein
MNLILGFKNILQRTSFQAKMVHERPDIAKLISGSKSLPNAVAKDLTEEQAKWLNENIGEFGKAETPIKYEPL